MQIVNRIENKLLNRVEISFRWQHLGMSTPSRKEVMDLVRTLEPGSNPDCIVVKNCNTRFGQPLTTGTAFIYDNEASMTVEPEYIHKVMSNSGLLRHQKLKKPLKEVTSDGRRS